MWLRRAYLRRGGPDPPRGSKKLTNFANLLFLGCFIIFSAVHANIVVTFFKNIQTYLLHTFKLYVWNMKFNSINKYLENNVSITRIFNMSLPFTLLGLISTTVRTVSYTHLDVYKRQIINRTPCFLICGLNWRFLKLPSLNYF